MSALRPTFHVLTPHYQPNGGVVKIMDYATHALAEGYRVSVWSPEQFDPTLPLFSIDRFTDLPDNPDVEFHSDERLTIRHADLVFVSLPRNYEVAYRSLPSGMSPERIIHIIQNVRHTNPSWEGGHPLRLLTRPAARISTNSVVAAAIEPWLDPRAFHEVINLGHDLGYFHLDRTGRPLSNPIRVAHTAWKSDIGDRVEHSVSDERFTFRGVRTHVSWSDLKELYHWADVFMCAPHPEEGFYMPALEAMESGCIVVTPDVGGNMAFCRPGSNCLLVEFESVDGYAAALHDIRDWPIEKLDAVRRAGYESTAAFDLERERKAFADYLRKLWVRIEDFEGPRSEAGGLTGDLVP